MYHCLFFRHSTIKKPLDETSRSLITIFVSILVSLLIASTAFSSGPLSVSSANPRYFFDSTGTPIYLAGTYLPHQQIELGTKDFTAYLDYLQQQKHNFTRLWAWEQTPVSAKTPMLVLPYERSGRGQALDGGTKFDLRRLNQTYFDQLRARVIEAAQRGIYVSVVLFQTLESQSNTGQDNPWYANAFNRDNNINRIDGDTNADGIGAEAFTLTIPAITSLQEAYVRKVVDTLNDLDNVLYEISGDGRLGSYAWQSYIINYLKNYQAPKANQHPVGIDALAGTTDNVFNSPADWIAFFGADLNPPLATGGKVLFVQLSSSLVDTSSGHQSIWKSFARGFNIIDKEPDSLTPGIAENLHAAIAQSLAYSQMINLAAMTPSDLACSTGYCLLKPGAEYLVYLPSGGSVTVDLSAAQQNFSADWFDPATGQTRAGTTVSGGTRVTLPSPFTGESILHLLLQAQSLNALTSTSLNSTTVTVTTNTMSNITNLSPTSSTISVTDSKKIVSTPTITPNGGGFAGSISVSLATATSGATVFYTVDGSSPTQSSKKYSGPILVASDALLKAKAFKNNVSPSSEASAWFSKTTNFDFTLANSGNLNVVAGSTVTNNISAALSNGSTQAASFTVSGLPSGATGSFSSSSCSPTCSTVLNITTSGSTPTGSFSITVSAAGGGITRTTGFMLAVTAPAIVATVATPTITPNGASFTNSVSVTITTATSGATIYYTTNGSTPTQSSTPYTVPMSLTTSAMVKAKAFKSGYNPSAAASASFTKTTTDPLNSGLVAYWNFDEGSGTIAADSSGNGNNGTLVNGPSWTSGIKGKALFFDGIDDNVTVPNSNSLNLANSFTLSAWVFPTAAQTKFTALISKNSTSDHAYFLYATSSDGYCGASGFPLAGANISGAQKLICNPSGLPLNAWSHLASTYDGSNLSLYLNGSLAQRVPVSGTIDPSTGPLQIAASYFGEYFQGAIDEVRIYNKALTPAELQTIYQQTATSSSTNVPGLVAYWNFDEGTGTMAADSSGNGNHGTLVNGTSWSTGIKGKALSFDGVADNVIIPDSSSLGLSKSFTLSAWVFPTAAQNKFTAVMSKNSASDHTYFLYASSSDGYCGGTGDPLAGANITATQQVICGQSGLPLNRWTHLVSSYDGSNLNLYVNGSLSQNVPANGAIDIATGPLQIGASYFGEYFQGSLDEVRVYNRALSPTEVHDVYQQNAVNLPFDYSITNSGDRTVAVGSSMTNTISAALLSGTPQALSFSVSGLPSPATASFAPTSCIPNCSTVLTIVTGGSTPAGNYPITVTSAGGGVKRSTVFTLTVSLALTVATPTITPNGATFSTSISVALQSATSGASIYYTMDGTTPTQSSTPYTGGMTLTTNTTIKAAAFKTGYNPSAVAAATFTNSITNTIGTGKTYYVGTNGSDSNSCTQAQNTSTPKRTILSGLACLTAANGDILDIRSGTYTDTIRSVISGTSYTNAATIRAHSGETVILTGGIALEGPSYVVFDGLNIRTCGIWVGSTTTAAAASHHIRFSNLDVTGISTDNLVNVNHFAHHIEFIGGRFYGAIYNPNVPTCAAAGTDACYAFYISGQDNLVERAKIYSNASYGIHSYSGYAEKPDRNIYRYNEFYDNGSHSGTISSALLLGSGTGQQAYGNIVRDNWGDGVTSSNNATNSQIYNNTVYNNARLGKSYGGIVWGSGSGVIIKNNIAYQNGVADIADSNGVQTPTFGANLCTFATTGCARSGNPLFVDPTSTNYQLQSGSPAIDAGAILTQVPAYDMNGTPRPQGAGWDIGAYER